MFNKNSKDNENAPTLEEQIHDAMQQEGWVIPTTPHAVLLMELRLAKATRPLSESLAGEPLSILETPSKVIALRSYTPIENPAVLENLARAARDAGELSSEIEEQMKRDRELAEKDDAK
jgi:hypothetical protein